MKNSKCTICRRLGTKLFLKGERCFVQKCAMVKRPYPPGANRKGARVSKTEYGKELREKQKLKEWYNLRERQFKNYVQKVLEKRGKVGDASVLLIKELETRFDNTVYRLGFATSRKQARQFVGHGHFLVSGKPIDVPSYQVKKGNIISLKPKTKGKNIFQNLAANLKKYNPPKWLELDVEKLEGKVVGEPTMEEVAPPVEISAIFEFYSK